MDSRRFTATDDCSIRAPRSTGRVEGIRQETASLGQIITNFLTFARPAQLTLTDVDLQALVDRTVDEVRPMRTRGGTIAVSGEFPSIAGDEVMLRRRCRTCCAMPSRRAPARRSCPGSDRGADARVLT
jgi:signal transduction histidine kinase